MSKRITTGHKLFYCNLEDKERNDDVMGGMRSLTMTKMTKYKELLKSTALEKSIFDNVCAGGGGESLPLCSDWSVVLVRSFKGREIL